VVNFDTHLSQFGEDVTEAVSTGRFEDCHHDSMA
jgi:hypothetical protein